MSARCKVLRLIVTVVVLLGTGVWSGHVNAHRFPSRITVTCINVSACAGDRQMLPAVGECSASSCMLAVAQAGTSADQQLSHAVVRYAVPRRTGSPGINPVPTPLPPRPAALTG